MPSMATESVHSIIIAGEDWLLYDTAVLYVPSRLN